MGIRTLGVVQNRESSSINRFQDHDGKLHFFVSPTLGLSFPGTCGKRECSSNGTYLELELNHQIKTV